MGRCWNGGTQRNGSDGASPSRNGHGRKVGLVPGAREAPLIRPSASFSPPCGGEAPEDSVHAEAQGILGIQVQRMDMEVPAIVTIDCHATPH